MPEAAVEEVQTEEPIVAPAPESSPEGDEEAAAAETRLDLIRELFKGAKADELRAALDEVPEVIRGELEAELEKKVEQRTQTRAKEVSTAKSGRKSTLEPMAAKRSDAQQWLARQVGKAKAGDFDALANPDQLIEAIDSYYNGGIAHVSLENEKALDSAIDKYLPDLTSDEQSALDKPLYEFGRTGEVAKALPKVMELAIERAKAEGFAEGVKKGEASKQAKAVLAEKLAKITDIKKSAPGTVNGRAATAADRRSALLNEMESIDVTTPDGHAEWLRRQDEFRRAVRAR